jgi:Ni/Co efflux regulator RcnB
MLRLQLYSLMFAILFSAASWAEKQEHRKEARHDVKTHHGTHRSGEREDYDGGERYHSERRDFRREDKRPYFDTQHRVMVREYYNDQFKRGHCPPGLAKKHNGCLPPGHAKRWVVGHTLPRDVIYYDLPDPLIRQIGYPPVGYRYARVGSDILLLAIGTGLIIDALTDLGSAP